MAGATWSGYQPALKETWGQDDFELQFYDDHPLFDEVERTDKHTIGEYVNLPLETYRNGGFSVTGTGGSTSLNPAGAVGVAQAQYALAFNYQQVKLDHPAMASSIGNSNAVANILDTELEGASSNMRVQMTRQAYADQTALICACTVATSATVPLNLTTGYDALIRGQLEIGMTVDIGSTSNEVLKVADSPISAVSISSSAPTITIGTSITSATTDFVSVANARAGTSSNEMNGLGNIISGSASLGGISASNRWLSYVDSTTTDLTLDSMLAVQEQQQQFAGKIKVGGKVLMGTRQGRRFYNLFQNQVRFQNDSQISVGNTAPISWNGMTIVQDADCPSTKVFWVQSSNLKLVTSPLGVHWANEFTGGQKISWAQNTTQFVGLFAYPCNLAANRRNTMAAMTALT
jgi:hypothetical protein